MSSSRYQGKQVRLIGRQKLEFYCQLCSKQCRDANGFKNHVALPSHQAKIAALGADAGATVARFSREFEQEFLLLLKRSHGTKLVEANNFYQEYIGARDHIHMNATRWRLLTEFVRHLHHTNKVELETQGERMTISLVDADDAERRRRAEALAAKQAEDDSLQQRLADQRVEQARLNQINQEKDKPVEVVTSQQPVKLSLKKKAATKRKAIFDD